MYGVFHSYISQSKLNFMICRLSSDISQLLQAYPLVKRNNIIAKTFARNSNVNFCTVTFINGIKSRLRLVRNIIISFHEHNFLLNVLIVCEMGINKFVNKLRFNISLESSPMLFVITVWCVGLHLLKNTGM